MSNEYFKNIIYSEEKITNIVFCIYIFLTTFCNTAWYAFCEGTIIYALLKIARYICYALFIVGVIYKFKCREYSLEGFGYFLLLLVLSFIGMFTGKDNSLFLTILFFMFIFGMNSQKLLRYALFIQGGVLFVTVVCSFLGLTDNSILDFERMRYSLGFSWTTFAPILYVFVSLLFIYFRKNKITLIECIALEVINIILYKFTNTKMSFAITSCVLLIIVFCLLSVQFKHFIKTMMDKLYTIILWLPAIGAFLACWLPLYNSQSKIWNIINSILSGRLWQCKNAITEYGFTLFGRYIYVETLSLKNSGTSDLTYFIDSGYLHFAMKYGIFVLFLLVALYSFSIWKAYKNKDYFMIGIFITLSIFCVNDLYLVNAFNVFTIYVFCDDDIFKEIPLMKRLSAWLKNVRLQRKES